LKVIGSGSVIDRGPADECAHPSGEHELWQESVVLLWRDVENAVGGFHRIGHEPNHRDGPMIALWNHIFTPHYTYKNSATLPLRDEDRLTNGFGGGDTCRFVYTDHACWMIDAPDVEAELHLRDCHDPIDIYPKSGTLAEDFAPNHMEVASKLSGSLTVKNVNYQLNGLAFRDHGWGKRDYSGLVCHRWVAVTFPDGTMALLQKFLSSKDELTGFGCLIRANTLTYAKDVDVIVYMEPDGLTHRGGRASMTLTTGEQMTFELVPFQKGVVSWLHGMACVDILCRVTCGDMVGVGDLEMTNNALRGNSRPRVAVNAFEANGLHSL
jgi:hypothetical protein